MEKRTFSRGHFAALTIAIRAKGYRRDCTALSLSKMGPLGGRLKDDWGEEVGELELDQLAKEQRKGWGLI